MGIVISVSWSPRARSVLEQVVEVAEGATVQQAIAQVVSSGCWPGIDLASLQVGIWGRAAAPDRALQQGDRIELCRPLKVDPKVARRERFKQQGSRSAGLFAKRRAGG